MDEKRGRAGSTSGGALALLFETAAECSGRENSGTCDQHTLGWVHRNLGLEIQRQMDEGASGGMDDGCWSGATLVGVAAAERELALAREQDQRFCPR